MPYKSKAQARKFHSDPRLKKYAGEWDRATEEAGGFEKLPKKVKQKGGRAAKPDPKPAHRRRSKKR